MQISNYRKLNRYIDADQNVWIVNHLIWKARELPIIDYSIENIVLDDNLFWKLDTTRDFLVHYEKVSLANLDYPIILSAEGIVMDGRHRLMKAILEGRKSIKAVKFEITPEPDYVDI
jgi:hypothetical protein